MADGRHVQAFEDKEPKLLSKHPTDFLVPAIVVLLFAVLGVTGLVSRLNGNVYDLFLRVQPTVAEDPSLLLVDIDDPAISNVGEWPWSRDVMANAMILMREMGAASTVFDIEYINPSPHGVNTQALTSTLPDAFGQEFSQIQANTQDLVNALRSGQIPLREAGKYVSGPRNGSSRRQPSRVSSPCSPRTGPHRSISSAVRSSCGSRPPIPGTVSSSWVQNSRVPHDAG